ncbi:FKBP-type peptidyl-prolyl cis-trans isomerase N-terminal domain-containing protein, partial [Flavihumibacter sp. CACIAM 22H1]|uniref:FKBP-type peptidyl-prolyl cis-trans isomerase N-terminal domain-containing protein n=1 Tax=Flavihumibacter sp. CACIAM 22H1 TaxID=1812911 RepID=UPI0025C55575
MRKILVSSSLLLCAAIAVAQTGGKPTGTPAKKPAAKTSSKPPAKTAAQAGPQLKTAKDSMSYAIGMSLANFYKDQGIADINTALVSKALNDALKNQPTLLTEEQMNMSITNYLQNLKKEKAA